MALGVYQDSVIDETGAPVVGLSIAVTDAVSGLAATIYSDVDGNTEITSGLSTAANGVVRFYAAAGFYDITFGTGDSAVTLPDVAIGRAQGYDVIDDDTMATAAATNLASAESTKAYVDVFNPAGAAVDLATVSSPIAVAAGSVVTATGNANGDKVFVVADGTYEGQATEFFILGDPNGNTIDITDSGGGELVGNAASGSSHVIVWSGSASTYATGSTTAPLGALAVLDTVAEGSVTVNDAGFPFSAETQDEMNAGLRDEIAASTGVPDPSVTTSNASSFVLTLAMRSGLGVVVESHQANVDFEVPADAPEGTTWHIAPVHAGCTASVVGDVGTIGGTTNLVSGRDHVVRVAANAGSAPDVVVSGGVVPTIGIATTKTYATVDHERFTVLKASAGDQTMPLAAAVPDGWMTHFLNKSGGSVNIVGADATLALADDGVATVKKLEDGSLTAFGTGGTEELDAA